jgi:uncharacterized protein YbjQ (UPF0145 family)
MANETDKAVAEAAKSLAESNKRIARASSDLAKATGTIGEAIGNSEGVKRISGMIDSIPFAGIAKGIGNVVFQKIKQKKEEKILRDSLQLSKTEFNLVKKQQELAKAQEAQLQALKDSAEKLGLNADAIIGVNENNVAVLSKSMEKALGMGEMTDSFTKLTMALNEKDKEAMSGAVEQEMKAEEQRNAFARNRDLIEAIHAIDIEVPEQKDEDKGWLGKIWDGIKGLGPMLLGGLTTLGGSIVAALWATARGGFNRLRNGFRGLRRGITRLPKAMGKLPAFASRAVGAVANAGRAVMSTAASAGGAAMRGAGGALKAGAKLARFIPGVGAIATIGMGLWDGLTAGFEAYKETGSLATAFKEGTAGALSGLTFGLVDQETISGAMDWVGEKAAAGWEGFKGMAGSAMEGISNFAGDAWSGMKDMAGSVGGWFSSWWSSDDDEKLTMMKDTATAGVNAATQAVSDAANAVNTKFKEMTGIDIGETVTATVDAVKNGAAALGTKFTELTGIEIPTDFAGVKTLIQDGASALSNKFTELTGVEVPSFEDIKTNISALGTNLSNKFTELTGMELPTFDDITSKFSELSSSLSDTFSNVTDKVGGWFSSWFSGDDPEARMSGGPVKAGAVYKINEAGQEMFIPNTDGYIANASRTQSLLAAGMDSNVQQSAAPVIINRGGSTTVNNNNPTMPLPIPITNRGADWATSGSF